MRGLTPCLCGLGEASSQDVFFPREGVCQLVSGEILRLDVARREIAPTLAVEARMTPMLSIPGAVLDGSRREEARLLSAPDGEARSALDDLERASLRQALWEMVGADTGDGLRKADLRTNIFNPRGSMRKAFSQQAPNILLGHLLATIRTQSQKRGSPSECFWKYCGGHGREGKGWYEIRGLAGKHHGSRERQARAMRRA
ncbi:hypothetical protein MC885_012757, partial [Smutsia gigantea]